MNVRQKIKDLMDLEDLTEYKLAKKADLPPTTVSNIFDRDYTPTISTLEAICKVFGITLSQFFAEDGEPVVLTEEQKTWLLQYSSLNETQRNIIQNTIQEFNK